MDAQTMVVTTDKVNLRAAPDKDSQRIEWLNKGDVVTVRMAYDNGWDFVAHGTKQGYVMARFLEATEDIPVEPSEPAPSPDSAEWLQKALEANEQERQALTMLQQLLTGAVG